MEAPKKQLCSIRMVLPVDSDEKAIEVKKKVESAVADIPEANIQFSLMNIPAGAKGGSPVL